MAYATLTQFRLVTHFKEGEISDSDVGSLIADADRAIIRLTTTEVFLESLEGDIDGSNKDFRTKYKPIADADADSSVGATDVTVYYATYDDVSNFIEYGSSQTVTSIQSKEGIITMTTAPTTTTAEAGVVCNYRYDTFGLVSYDILKLAACYYLAYMVASKSAGELMTYRELAAARFKPAGAGGDWLRLCFETLGLQDKIYLVRAEGESLQYGAANNF